MAKIWRNRIIDGTRRFDEVPMTWKTQVKNLLRADVFKGIITAEEYRSYVGESYRE